MKMKKTTIRLALEYLSVSSMSPDDLRDRLNLASVDVDQLERQLWREGLVNVLPHKLSLTALGRDVVGREEA